MRALRYTTFGASPQVVDVDRPDPGPGQVLIRVRAAGLCHTDIGVLSSPPEVLDAWRITLPATLGHETAGTVVSVGEGVTGAQVSVDGGQYAQGGTKALVDPANLLDVHSS